MFIDDIFLRSKQTKPPAQLTCANVVLRLCVVFSCQLVCIVENVLIRGGDVLAPVVKIFYTALVQVTVNKRPNTLLFEPHAPLVPVEMHFAVIEPTRRGAAAEHGAIGGEDNRACG